MKIEQRATKWFDKVPGRKVLGVVLHSTETYRVVDPRWDEVKRRGGSWHYEIGRPGQVIQFIRDEDTAWHASTSDEPGAQQRLKARGWLRKAPRGWTISSINYSTIGIELVSNAKHRATGVAYTDSQYASLRKLCTELEQRHGLLVYERHGDLQRNRSDPVQLDLVRAGFKRQADGGYLFRPTDEVTMALADVDRVQELISALEDRAAAAEDRADANAAQAAAQSARADGNFRTKMDLQSHLQIAIGVGNRAGSLSNADQQALSDLNAYYARLTR